MNIHLNEFLKQRDLITERYINQIDDEDLKREHADAVWDILQNQYREIGGIKGSGFNSKEDMIKNIPFWKMIMKDGVVHGVVMYKDSSGRKSVQMGTLEGSRYGLLKVRDIMKADSKRSYSERSKAQLGLTMKVIPWDILKELMISFREVKRDYPDAVSVNDIPFNELPKDARDTLTKFPQLTEFGYLRMIGPEMTFKVMLGTRGLEIT